MTEHDAETGELPFNGIGARAQATVANNRIALERERKGVGQTNIQHAMELAVRQMPIWITDDETGDAGKYKYRYASLKAILKVVRPILEQHGIRLRHRVEHSRPTDDGGGVKGRLIPVYTDFVHAFSGEIESSMVEVPLVRLDPQAMGSAVSYGKRYSLLAGLGLATDEADDDGARAMPRDITTKASDGAELQALKAEIDDIAKAEKGKPGDKLAALTKWATDPKVKRRMDALPEGELERLRIYYVDTREGLGT